jgi:hypothetical protein
MNTAVAAVVLLFAMIYGSRSLIGVVAAGAQFAQNRGEWDQAKSQLLGSCMGLALAVLVGTASFNLGGDNSADWTQRVGDIR